MDEVKMKSCWPLDNRLSIYVEPSFFFLRWTVIYLDKIKKSTCGYGMTYHIIYLYNFAL